MIHSLRNMVWSLFMFACALNKHPQSRELNHDLADLRIAAMPSAHLQS
jgi:hypothetical protein